MIIVFTCALGTAYCISFRGCSVSETNRKALDARLWKDSKSRGSVAGDHYCVCMVCYSRWWYRWVSVDVKELCSE